MTQTVLMILFLTIQGWAMEPYYPEKMEIKSNDSKLILSFSEKTDPKIIELPKKKVKYTWKKVRAEYPSQVLFNSKSNFVFFIGGLGDPGSDLGKVKVYDLKTGKVLHTLDLRKNIPDLEDMSRKYQDMGNFVWISKAELSEDGNTLTIIICDLKKLTFNLGKDTLKIVDIEK